MAETALNMCFTSLHDVGDDRTNRTKHAELVENPLLDAGIRSSSESASVCARLTLAL